MLCGCGCGKDAGLYTCTLLSKDIVKGQPRRFIRYHSKLKNKKLLVCETCHKSFQSFRSNAKTCSKNCMARAYYTKNIEQERKRNRDKHKRWRDAVLAHYGNVCACPGCAVTTPEFLAVDHVNGDGKRHRKSVNNIFRWLIANNFPASFQLLCHNCNAAKGFYGECPHLKEEKSKACQTQKLILSEPNPLSLIATV